MFNSCAHRLVAAAALASLSLAGAALDCPAQKTDCPTQKPEEEAADVGLLQLHRNSSKSQLTPYEACVQRTWKLFSCEAFAAEAPSFNIQMKKVTPGNYDQEAVNYNFGQKCIYAQGSKKWLHTKADGSVERTAPGAPGTFDDVAKGPAALNRKYGWKRVTFKSQKGDPSTCGSSDTCGGTPPTISAWYYPSQVAEARPTIVIIHGFHVEATYVDPIVESSFYRNNLSYNVLALDLRNHGHSDTTNGFRSFGQPEALDVLAAIKCVENGCVDPVRKTDISQIGIHGVSAGGQQAYQAFALEPRLRGMWVDSGIWTLLNETSYEVGQKLGITNPTELKVAQDAAQAAALILGRQWGYSTWYMPEIISIPSSSPPRRVFLAGMEHDTYVPPSIHLKHAALRLKQLNYSVETLLVPTPGLTNKTFSKLQSLGKLGCDRRNHVAEKLADPKLFVSFMRGFWDGVFAGA